MKLINEAVNALLNGGVIIFPTETCYGLGADATNPLAVKRVFFIKNRPFNKPLSIIVSSISMIEEYAFINSHVKQLIKDFMPGPLTIIVRNKKLPDALCGHSGTVGFRIPSHPVALELVKRFGKPITATSANLSGEPENYSPPDLPVDFTINIGELPHNPPSTIYDSINNRIIRQGSILLS